MLIDMCTVYNSKCIPNPEILAEIKILAQNCIDYVDIPEIDENVSWIQFDIPEDLCEDILDS